MVKFFDMNYKNKEKIICMNNFQIIIIKFIF